MKKFCLLVICLLALFVAVPLARAQGNAKQGPEVLRDPDLEKDSLHNLEVARHYFKLKKAYIAALQRCEEIIAGNPVFSKIDDAPTAIVHIRLMASTSMMTFVRGIFCSAAKFTRARNDSLRAGRLADFRTK